MDVIALIKEGFQSVAEHAASYKFGQTVLRHVDKALWVVEKCARWAVPPPLDPEERPQPELVRPLPWVFFLMMLVTLRITRESISLINLVLGKPPLRSADVVTYIQGKRRYLRTLKYQGNRMMRARTGTTQEPWYAGLRSLFEFTMCFKRQSVHYGNNNTTRVSNNDEILVVKRTKRPRQQETQTASTSEACMERLIEKMMADMDADSDEDSSYTLTNATSVKSDRSDTAESDPESTPNAESTLNSQSPVQSDPASQPEQTEINQSSPATKSGHKDTDQSTPASKAGHKSTDQSTPATKSEHKETEQSKPASNPDQNEAPVTPEPQAKPDHVSTGNQSPKEPTPETKQTYQSEEPNLNTSRRRMVESQAFLQSERHPRSPKKEKIANGRTVKSTSERNIGGEKRNAVVRAASADFFAREKKENNRQTP